MNIFKKAITILAASLCIFSSKISVTHDDHITNAFVGGTISQETYNRALERNTDHVFTNDCYMSQYFLNLTDNFPLNSHGSCGYVAISMLLSYYDTYWSDGFIPEGYETTSEVASFTDTGIPTYTVKSPGATRYDYGSIDKVPTRLYLERSLQNYTKDFQALLFSIAENTYGEIPLDSSLTIGTTFDQMLNILDTYLFKYIGMPTSMLSIKHETDRDNVWDFTIEQLRMGRPVIVRSNQFGGHVSTAYDYDPMGGILYGHAGIDGLNHVPLGNRVGTDWYDATVIVTDFDHQHTNNYIAASETYCPCAYGEVPSSVALSSDAKRDVAPNLVTTTKYRDTWSPLSNRHYVIEIKPISSKKILLLTLLNGSKALKIPDDNWKNLIYDPNGYKFRVNVKQYSGINSNRIYSKIMEKPIDYREYTVIDMADLVDQLNTSNDGFEEYEASDQTFKLAYSNISVRNNITAQLNPYVESYMTFNLYDAVESIDFDISYAQTHVTNDENDVACIYETHGWDFTKKVDFVAPDVALVGNTNEKTIVHIEFDSPTYRFSIRSNSRRGLMLDQIAVKFAKGYMPLSGGELEYEPSKWNSDKVVKKFNCYSYALNTQDHGWMNSDPYSNLNKETDDDCQRLLNGFITNSENLGFIYKEIDKFERCEPGTYKVALVVFEKIGYHWYRQNADGTWSHKNGTDPVTHLGLDGNLLYDPQNDSLITSKEQYLSFFGFFEVSPLSYL